MRWSLYSDALFFLPKNKEVRLVNLRQRKKYKRLTYEDRKKIEKLYQQGKTIDEMSLLMGVHSTTMYREIARGGEPYSADKAQQAI